MEHKSYVEGLSDEEKELYRKAVNTAYKAEWDIINPEKIWAYRRASTLKRCEERCSVPTKKTINRYKFTPEELKPIYESLWNVKITQINSAVEPPPDDKEDNIEAHSE